MDNERYFSDPHYAIVSTEIGDAILRLINDVRPLVKFMLSYDLAHAGELEGYDGLDTKGTFEILTAYEHLQRELHEERFLQRFLHAELNYYRRIYRDDVESHVFRVRVDNGTFALGSPRIVFLAILFALEQELLHRSLQLEWTPHRGSSDTWYGSMRTSLVSFLTSASVWKDDQETDVAQSVKADLFLRTSSTVDEEVSVAPVEIVVDVKGAKGAAPRIDVVVGGQIVYSTNVRLPSSRIQAHLLRKPFYVKASEFATTSSEHDLSKLLSVVRIQHIHPQILAVFNSDDPSIVQTLRINSQNKESLWYKIRAVRSKSGRIVGIRRSKLGTYQTLAISSNDRDIFLADHRYGEGRLISAGPTVQEAQVQYGVLQNKRHEGYETNDYILTLPDGMFLSIDSSNTAKLAPRGTLSFPVYVSAIYDVEAAVVKLHTYVLRAYRGEDLLSEIFVPHGVTDFFATETAGDLWVAWHEGDSCTLRQIYAGETYKVSSSNMVGLYATYDRTPRILERGNHREVIVRTIYGTHDSYEVDGDVVYACIADYSILVVQTAQGKIWFFSLHSKSILDILP